MRISRVERKHKHKWVPLTAHIDNIRGTRMVHEKCRRCQIERTMIYEY